MLGRWISVGTMLGAMITGTAAAEASVKATIDLGTQRMSVYIDGKLTHTWAVSTAREGYVTPTGRFRVQRTERMWYSRKYDLAPMPHSIFFSGGYAIHGTTSVRMLGRPASHGCVRLAPSHAAQLFALVKQHGPSKTEITIHGRPPAALIAKAPKLRIQDRTTVARATPARPFVRTAATKPATFAKAPQVRVSTPVAAPSSTMTWPGDRPRVVMQGTGARF